jgi:phosphoribosylanthranilate isomerase
VGVFVRQGREEIAAIMAEARLDMAQLHGEQGRAAAEALGPERVIKVFWPERQLAAASPEAAAAALAEEMESWRGWAKWFLIDAGTSAGGHGRKLSARFSSPAPYLLAGGLTAADIIGAWPPQDRRLAGFDLSSSLESAPGRKDPAAIRDFFAALSALPPRAGLAG